MGKISVGRVIAGGLLAGLVINVSEFLVNMLWLAADWEAAMKALGITNTESPTQIMIFVVWGFVMGMLAVWLYAAIRPRFGPGPKTAAIAAFAVWLSGYVLAMVPPAVMGMFPIRLMVIGTAVGIVEILIGTQLGAAVYKEQSASD